MNNLKKVLAFGLSILTASSLVLAIPTTVKAEGEPLSTKRFNGTLIRESHVTVTEGMVTGYDKKKGISISNQNMTLTGLHYFTNLNRIVITNCGVVDISEIKDLEKLVHVDFTGNEIYSLSCLANSKYMASLNNYISKYSGYNLANATANGQFDSTLILSQNRLTKTEVNKYLPSALVKAPVYIKTTASRQQGGGITYTLNTEDKTWLSYLNSKSSSSGSDTSTGGSGSTPGSGSTSGSGSEQSGTNTDDTEKMYLGDLNDDGVVDSLDLVLAKQLVLGINTIEVNMYKADYNYDKVFDLNDVMAIAEIIIGRLDATEIVIKE